MTVRPTLVESVGEFVMSRKDFPRDLLTRSRPLKVNKFVFVVPSHTNKYLEEFVAQCPRITTINQLIQTSRGTNCPPVCQCVKGLVMKLVTNKSSFMYVTDDKSTELYTPSVKVCLSERHVKQLKSPGRNSLVYINGGHYKEDSSTAPCISGDLLCVFVSESLYRKLKKCLVPVVYVSSIPLNVVSQEIVSKRVFPTHSIANINNNNTSNINNNNTSNIPRHTTSTPQLSFRPPRYSYLRDLKKDTIINVVGCVQHFKPPNLTKTRRGYYQSFTITDMSLPPGKEVSVTVFGRGESDFPSNLRVGDIVMLRSVSINMYKMFMQITCRSPKNLFIYDPSREIEVIREYPMSSLELQIISSLKEWVLRKGSLNSRGRLCKIRDIVPGLHFDLECIVSSIQIKDSSLCMSVYDETASCSISVPGIHPSFTFSEGQSVYLFNVHAVPLYSKGTRSFELHLMQHIFRGICFSKLPLMQCQYFVSRQIRFSEGKRFTNLTDVLNNKTIPIMHRCKVRVQGIETESVEKCIHLLCSKCNKKHSMKRTGDDTALASELTQECMSCKKDGKLMYAYFIPLYITDDTASMTVPAVKKEAQVLFRDLKPSNPYLDRAFRNKLLRYIEILIGRNPFDTKCSAVCSSPLSPPPLPPIMDCCIISYYVGCTPKTEEERRNARIRYQISNTQLIAY